MHQGNTTWNDGDPRRRTRWECNFKVPFQLPGLHWSLKRFRLPDPDKNDDRNPGRHGARAARLWHAANDHQWPLAADEQQHATAAMPAIAIRLTVITAASTAAITAAAAVQVPGPVAAFGVPLCHL